MTSDADARIWLRANNYQRVADQIDEIMSTWRKKGLGTRRNWWDVLAGTRDGDARSVAGVTFPVLAAARERKGWESSPEDLGHGEVAPTIALQARWSDGGSAKAPDLRTQRVPKAGSKPAMSSSPTSGGKRKRVAKRRGQLDARDPSNDVGVHAVLDVKKFAQIEHARIAFGDLTVLVGPQATGKSLLLQWLKVAIDAGEVIPALKEAGHDVKSAETVLDLVFGEGMSRAWHDGKTAVSLNGKDVRPSAWTKGLKTKTEGRVFFVPAHRALLLAEGWPAPFMKLNADTPAVARLFSQNLYQRFSGRQASALFPVDRILKQEYRHLIDQAVFHGGKVELQKEGLRYRLRLTYDDGVSLPFMTWTAGQREFTPLLLGLYHVLPSRKEKKREEIDWVVIEEPEMGLHPQGITVVMLLVLDLLWRGYRVVISTHSPLVLDVVWAIQRLAEHRARWQLLCEAFAVAPSQQIQPVMARAMKHSYRVHYLNLEPGTQRVTSRDISNLDPGALEESERGWGGLTRFSAGFGKAVRTAANEGDE